MSEPRAAPTLPPGIQTKCDAQINTVWTQLQADEPAYIASHGGYWQGLITHQHTVPNNGVDAPADVGTLTPTDQPVPWPTVYLQSPLAIACTVDVYDGPLGKGYVLTALLTITQLGPQGQVLRWQRRLAVGPEPGWEQPWTQLPDPIIPGSG